MPYEYHANTKVGPLVLRQGDDGRWRFYLGGQEWVAVGDFRIADRALEALTLIANPFPPHAGKIGDSHSLGLPDRLSDWARVSIKKPRKTTTKA